VSQLIDIFMEPAKVWAEQKERPTFLVPALLVTLAIAIPAMLYFFRVDPQWFADYQLQALGQEMSAAEVEQAKAFMPGARASGWITAITSVVFMAVMFTIMSVYYLLAGKVAGHAVDFRRGLSLATWASMPLVLGGLVVLVAVFTSSPQSSYESMQMLNVDPLFVHLPMDHSWSLLARSFSLLNFWCWFLAALGWKTWFRTGWGQAIFVVLLPSVVIYGVMALFALL
jgi:hypothetical protein